MTNITRLKFFESYLKKKKTNVFGVKPSLGQFDRPRDCVFMSIGNSRWEEFRYLAMDLFVWSKFQC